MTNREKALSITGLLTGAGLLAFLVYEFTQGNITNISDVYDQIQSLGVRAYLIARGTMPTANAKDIAAKLIAQEEGFSSHVYADPPGQSNTYSIGYGHQLVAGDGFDQSSTVDQPTAFNLLLNDLDSFAACVDSAVQVEITDNERAALYSFCYNIGCRGFQTSTMLRDINAGDLGAASGEFDRWVYSNGQIDSGLQTRRNDEQALFSSDGFDS
jgi:lysozyme